ncbi:hypothetical protein CA11_29100 [Gimesia maris]|nr:hypothetical protein CA11_29100 [Gimesia maris]
MTIISHENRLGNVKFQNASNTAVHSSGMDLLLQLANRSRLKVATTNEIINTQILSESEFLKLLRTEFTKSERK